MNTPHKTEKDKKFKGVLAGGKSKKSAGQSHGDSEEDQKHSTGQYQGAGDPPLMKK